MPVWCQYITGSSTGLVHICKRGKDRLSKYKIKMFFSHSKKVPDIMENGGVWLQKESS